MTAHRCPNCDRGVLENFYVQEGVPVNSVVLIRDQKAARSFPTGDIALGRCPDCGFSGNTRFDASRVRYDATCEETQGASPTFGAYHDRLAAELAGRYRLRGSHVAEIGCGKAEFLALLRRHGAARATGFDPAFVPGRLHLPERVVVHRESFGPGHVLDDADFLCCKMTLEHVAEPLRFLRDVRAALRNGTPVFFQVPDAGRIYREFAFQDVYYEHCSYFTESSLRIAFGAAGFSVDEVKSAYAGQYLSVHARAIQTPYSPPREATLTDETGVFSERVEAKCASWRERIRGERRVVLWGGGSKAVAFLTRIGLGAEVASVVDVNPRKHGTYLPGSGHPVVAPPSLAGRPPSLVILMNGIYRDEVAAALRAMELDAVLETLDPDT